MNTEMKKSYHDLSEKILKQESVKRNTVSECVKQIEKRYSILIYTEYEETISISKVKYL